MPAIVVHGNSLSAQQWAHWATPAHVLGGWDWRLRKRSASEQPAEFHSEASAGEAARQHAAPMVEQIAEVRDTVVSRRLDQMTLFD